MSQLSITTTQNVNINFEAASLGERILAYLLDLVIWIAYSVVLSIILNLTDFDSLLSGMDNWSVMTIYTILYLPVIFYALVMESLLEGQTVGKKVMKIKVIK